MSRLIFEGQPIEFAEGDSALIAILRAGQTPTAGGCLCLGGDCPHCLATVDGVAYVRTCQVKAKPGMVIDRHPAQGDPPLPPNVIGPRTYARNLHCDVIVIGQGESGQAAANEARQVGKQVITLEATAGQEVIGIYDGLLVVARTSAGMWHVHAHDEVIVATGAAEIQPVVPGNDLAGIVTARAAAQLAAANVALGRVVAIGTPPVGVAAQAVEGQLVRVEGDQRVRAVVVRNQVDEERRYECDTVSVGLGFNPRDTLLRIGNGLRVRAVGDAAQPSDIPPCPLAGVVCACSQVTVEALDSVWQRGFHELELVKRATLAGTGTCQGAVCVPHIRSFIKARGGELQAPFTARPVTRQPTMAETSAGAYHHPTPRTALDAEHRRLGAYMDRVGGWWRPWNYGNVWAEYWAVREAVSIGDVSTLGKMVVSGPDALELLERLYPTKVSTLAAGRSRYVLILDDRGYVLDDGLILKDSDTRYTLTFTSGGASTAEMWLRDWAEAWKFAERVRILNQTMSLGAINVTGPLAQVLLARAGFTTPIKYMQHVNAEVAGVSCKVMRLSFTGEQSYELHHPAEQSPRLWRSLLELGSDLGIKPHGIQALLKLRLEKGHVIVGQDTDFDSTPRRLAMEWAVKLDKQNFVGRQAVTRTNKVPLDKQLAGFVMAAPAPLEGAVIWNDGEYAGYVTSSTYSPVLGKVVMLGWLKLFDGQLPESVTIDERPAQRAAIPFYDREGHRAKA